MPGARLYRLYTWVNRNKVAGLWPIPLPEADGRENEWHRSAHAAAVVAMQDWVRIVPDRSLNGYTVCKATGDIEEPSWPKVPLSKLLSIAFGEGRFIRDPEHPITTPARPGVSRPMLPFREVWHTDFEFRADDGERPSPVCAVFREHFTGREIRLWQDELAALKRPPIPIDRGSLFVAFYASAELGNFLELGWPLPAATLDLFVEHRAESNGIPNGVGNGLLGALAWHGLDAMSATQKDAGRALVMRGGPWSNAERVATLDYCAADVDASVRLLPKMLPAILMRGDTPLQGWGQAMLRARYMGAAARMERQGVPIDLPLLTKLRENWPRIVDAIVGEIAADFPVYEGKSFREKLFADYLQSAGIHWPMLESGRLKLDDDTFREMARGYPREIWADSGKCA